MKASVARASVAVAATLGAPVLARADVNVDEDQQLAPAPQPAQVPDPSTAPPPIAPPRRLRTPFDRGTFGLALGGGSQTQFGQSYIAISGGSEYFALDGVGVGVSGVVEFGSGPTIGKLQPQLRYVVQPLVGTWPLIPYAGVFYDHWFIGGGYADIDGVGARAGLLYVANQLVLGLGVAVEHDYNGCSSDCDLVYPDFTLSLAL